MPTIVTTNQFENDIAKCKKRGLNLELLEKTVKTLEKGEKLPVKYKTHPLDGEYKGSLECHILDDWLLVWEYDKKKDQIKLERTGKHTDIFKKFK